VADPNWDNVSLLLKCDGSNGSTTLTDQSKHLHSITALGNAQLLTSDKKFGTASLRASTNAAAGAIQTPSSTLFSVGANSQFTAELWFRIPAWPASTSYITLLDLGEVYIYLHYTSGTGIRRLTITGASDNFSASLAIGNISWYHLAYVRNGTGTGMHKLYLDGVERVSVNNTITLTSAAQHLAIGDTSLAFAENLRADEIRVTSGVARYTGAFTPPSAEFEFSSGATGIASTVAFGTPTANSPVTVQATGISPTLQLGQPDAAIDGFAFADGFDVGVQYGTPYAVFGQVGDASGISGANFGTPASLCVFRASTLGVVSQFGTPTTPVAVEAAASGFAVGAFGTPAAIAYTPSDNDQTSDARWVDARARLGTPTAVATVTGEASGIAPAAAFGEPEAVQHTTAEATALEPGAVVGEPGVMLSQPAEGFRSTAFGQATVALVLAADALEPGTTFGEPDQVGDHMASGWASSRMGHPVALNRFNYPAAALEPGATFGTPAAVEGHRVTMLPPTVAFGTPLLLLSPAC
jgi:hypothetical protein